LSDRDDGVPSSIGGTFYVVVNIYVRLGPHLLILKRAKGSGRNSGRWTVPGGFVEPGEEPEHAGLRELREETGLQPSGLDLVGVGRADGRRDGADALFIAYACQSPTSEIAISDEHDMSRWILPTDYLAECFPAGAVERLRLQAPRQFELLASLKNSLEQYLDWLRIPRR